MQPQFPARTDVAPAAVLGEDGEVAEGVEPTLDVEQTLTALGMMMLTRRFDARAVSLQRQGRFGTISPVHGQEASVVGTAMALDPDRDWVVPQYRELPALLLQGLPLERFVAYFLGHPDGGRIPRGVHVLPLQIGIAAQLPHAVGLAWGLRHQGRDAVVMVYCGDGASSEGDFHEALNLAGVGRHPVVFVVQNNGWAISTPTSAQTAASRLAARATGYGMPGVVVDGNDLFAVHAAATEAVARARRGEGPTLLESLTFRMGPHNTSDDPSRYVDPELAATWEERDPIPRVQRYLAARGRWDDEVAGELGSALDAEIESALERAYGAAPPAVRELADHAYADEPPRVTAQRRWFEEPGGPR